MNYLDYRNNLDSIVCICEVEENLTNGCQNKVGPIETLKYLKKNFNELKSMGLITSQKDFIMAPIYNGESNNRHWTVAIILQDRIDMFDSTLQQKNTFKIDNKLLPCDGTTNAEKQIQNENGKICGLCSTEFIIEASKCESLEHIRQNMNVICNKVAANVIEAIGPENIETQLTKDFQNNNEILPSRGLTKSSVIGESQNVSKSEPIQQMKRGFIQTRTKTCKQRQTNKQQRPLPGKRIERKNPFKNRPIIYTLQF